MSFGEPLTRRWHLPTQRRRCREGRGHWLCGAHNTWYLQFHCPTAVLGMAAVPADEFTPPVSPCMSIAGSTVQAISGSYSDTRVEFRQCFAKLALYRLWTLTRIVRGGPTQRVLRARGDLRVRRQTITTIFTPDLR